VKLVEVIVKDELEHTRNPESEKICPEKSELSMIIVLFTA
jgi:hypothetical protein